MSIFMIAAVMIICTSIIWWENAKRAWVAFFILLILGGGILVGILLGLAEMLLMFIEDVYNKAQRKFKQRK